ncbi:hypothetical protein K7432_016156 [Basidiobolus ranarum]|uniref:Uncharacterized protein n=1 Tax=Basidiobolus ranarum TaxID=34480 RepID=A0ABR2WF34_9FUNG
MSIQFKALSAGSADCPPAPYVFNSTYTFNKDISGCMISPSQGLLYDPNSKIDITWNFSSGSCNSYINGAFAAAGSRVFSFGTRYLCGSDRYDQHTSVTSSLSGSSVSNAPICPECAGDHVTLYLAIEKSTGVTYAGGVESNSSSTISFPYSEPIAADN